MRPVSTQEETPQEWCIKEKTIEIFLFGHSILLNDLRRRISIDSGEPFSLSQTEYLLLLSFFERGEVSYQMLAHVLFECDLDEPTLVLIRKRVHSIRKKIVKYGITIMTILHHGYMLRDITHIPLMEPQTQEKCSPPTTNGLLLVD